MDGSYWDHEQCRWVAYAAAGDDVAAASEGLPAQRSADASAPVGQTDLPADAAATPGH